MTSVFANKMRFQLESTNIKAFVMHTSCRYRIEQELGTEIKPIPPIIEKDLYCS